MALFSKQKTVPQSTYDTLQAERDGFEKEVSRLQHQVSVLVINEDVTHRLAHKAVALLGRLEAGRKVTVGVKREIDALLASARSAGLIEEEKEHG